MGLTGKAGSEKLTLSWEIDAGGTGLERARERAGGPQWVETGLESRQRPVKGICMFCAPEEGKRVS